MYKIYSSRWCTWFVHYLSRSGAQSVSPWGDWPCTWYMLHLDRKRDCATLLPHQSPSQFRANNCCFHCKDGTDKDSGGFHHSCPNSSSVTSIGDGDFTGEENGHYRHSCPTPRLSLSLLCWACIKQPVTDEVGNPATCVSLLPLSTFGLEMCKWQLYAPSEIERVITEKKSGQCSHLPPTPYLSLSTPNTQLGVRW